MADTAAKDRAQPCPAPKGTTLISQSQRSSQALALPIYPYSELVDLSSSVPISFHSHLIQNLGRRSSSPISSLSPCLP